MTTLRIPDLAGKAVLITGASTGIGAAVAEGFAAQGAHVGLHYNASAEAAEALKARIEAAGGTVTLVKADVTDAKALERAVADFAQKAGRLDGLINNAGGMVGRKKYDEMDDDYYDAVMDLNGRSVIAASRAAIPFLKTQGGFIINTTSVAGRNGAGPGAGLYGSSKAFVANITRGMAKELAPFNIRVNSVAPGVITTPFHERYSTDQQLEAMRVTIPSQRLGTADECVGVFLFLASDLMSSYISGQEIHVNGGQLMP